MLCTICRNMLGRQEGRFAKGTFDLRYEHHTSAGTFERSVQQHCYICRALYIRLLVQVKHGSNLQPRRDSAVLNTHVLEEQHVLSELTQKSLRSTASLFLHRSDHTYRLEIDLRQDQTRIQHTFHLESWHGAIACPDQHSVHVKYRKSEHFSTATHTPPNISPGRDYGAAIRWLKGCKCYTPRPGAFYPARLISLEKVKASVAANGNSTSYHRGTKVTVNLVETWPWHKSDRIKAGYNGGNNRYVTLSHCWGGQVSHRLLRSNYDDRLQGIPVDELPKTFQDAVYFAASLEEVGYIWIDSLCIIQEDEQDWLEQSVEMDRVYSETFLNLSATAALNSKGGLFRDGEFELLKEESVSLNIEGLPLAYDRKDLPRCLHDRKRFLLRQCTITDASFWANEVDKGPVNTRGWVLQERLMSPRVLHFCQDQVGWECACCNTSQPFAARGRHKLSVENQGPRYHSIVEGIRQRMMDANHEANADTPTVFSPFEIWAAVVTAYSKTAISYSQDKLIALSGLAKIIAEETGCAYVAGLWRTHLASQLLWYVDPVYHPVDRSFSHQATVPNEARAPSFSWSAIDVTGHGITYAKTTDRGLLVRIEDATVNTLGNHEFGVVLDAHIILWGKLRKARLISLPNNRFAWHLLNRRGLDDELHKNVYLDCPLRDADCIDNTTAAAYVLPVAREVSYAGTSRNEYLLCLILRPGDKRGVFKRIGVTKLSPLADRKAMSSLEINGKAGYKILEAYSDDAMLPHVGYDRETGMHRIRLT